jgi:chlorophyll synthase
MRWLDFFFALRPLVLVPAWSFFLLGHVMARADAGPGVAAAAPWWRCLSLTLVLAGAYLVNQIVDFETDRLNGKGLFLQRGLFGRRLYGIAAAIGIGLGLGLALGRGEAPGLVALAAGLGLAYSLPPVRLAARPGLDLAANAMGYGGVALALGAGPALQAGGVWGWRLAAAVLAVAAVFLHTTLMDLDGDRRSGKRTSGVALGERRTRNLAAACAVAGGLAATQAQALGLLAPAALLALWGLAAALAPARATSRSLCVAASGSFALAAGIAVPAFLAGTAALALATRWYYRRRFAIAYPAL